MKHTILIAEDDRDITELLTLYLTGAEFDVQSAADGAQALEMIRAGGISLVLADIMMPGLNGYELIRQVRTFSNLPIIILSAKALDTDKAVSYTHLDVYKRQPYSRMQLSPVLSFWMMALPVRTCCNTLTWSVRTSAAANSSSRKRPSSPTAPAIQVSAPARASAIA